MNHSMITIDQEGYPEHLRSIPDPPSRLYYIGDLSVIAYPAVAIVGTRRCSPYGQWAAREIAKRVAGCGIPVISGMAEGIDSFAHRGCIDGGAPTVAVLGTGIDRCFPLSNEKLYRRIMQEGLLISEYEPGTPGYSSNFPKRNRIISGLSKSVIIVEGALRSGSMITARLALEQGRDVFAVPGNINQPNSLGVNKLIADGACPIMELESVPELLGIGPGKKAKVLQSLSDEEKIIVGLVIESPGINAENIAFRSSIPLRTVSVLASALELKGLIFAQGQRLYVSA